jgi:hypothetical protein
MKISSGKLEAICLLFSSAVLAAIVTTTNDSGAGSLRQAIADASSGETITFTNTLDGQTIVLTSGQLSVSNNLTIDASALPGGIAIDGNGTSRIFEFTSNTTSVITGLTLTNGYASGGNPDGYGGAVLRKNAHLTINDCDLSSNVADRGGGGIYAAAVQYSGSGPYVEGSFTINDSSLSGNFAQFGGGISKGRCTATLNNVNLIGNSASGSVWSAGGGMDNNIGTLTVNKSTFSGNSAIGGGGIRNFGTLSVNKSTFSGNSAEYGGGIYNDYDGTVTINNSTISGNSTNPVYSLMQGGGIANDYILIINNSTISGNGNSSCLGGGMDNYDGTLTVNNSTLSSNSAIGGGGIFNTNGTLTITNTIVAGNTAPTNANIYIIDSSFSGANNLTSGDPLLAGLGDYGGPTQTMPPLRGSPAIDAGLDTGSLPATDQRGHPRIINGTVDIGACESFYVTDAQPSASGCALEWMTPATGWCTQPTSSRCPSRICPAVWPIR